MILLGYDIETTGTDKLNDRVIEIGLTLYSTGQRRNMDSLGWLVQSDGVVVSQEITEINGITQAAVDKFGYTQEDALDRVIEFAEQADAIATQNGRRFDMPMTLNWANRLGRTFPDRLLIDTMTDLPGVMGEKLVTMCAQHGFLNPFPHAAEADEQSTLKLLSYYDINDVVERAKSPLILLQSHQERFKNDEVKKHKFRWNPLRKLWWKAIKEIDEREFINRLPFEVSRLDKSITIEDLED